MDQVAYECISVASTVSNSSSSWSIGWEKIVDIVQLFGVIAALFIWRWQILYGKKLDIASDAIHRCDDLENGIDRIRNPNIQNVESNERQGTEQDSHVRHMRNLGFAKQRRIDQNRDELERFLALRGRFLAYFGNDFEDAFQMEDFHHIGGRDGCLRWLVENGVIVSRTLHILEKSLDSRERSKFHHFVQKLVGKKRYTEMIRIKNWYRYVGNGHDMPPK